MEKVKQITTSTLIPISLVISIGSIIFGAAVISTKVSAHSEEIHEIKEDIKNIPSKDSYDDLKDKVDTIYDYILNNK